MTTRRRTAALVAAFVVAVLTLAVPGADAEPRAAAPSASPSAAAPAPAARADGYRRTREVTRTFVDSQGNPVVQSSNRVTVRAEQTRNLRGRQRVLISWSGAQPSGGRASNPYGARGMQQEFPVVILQCRGRDDASLPPAQQVRPETCWTSSFSQRSQVQKSQAIESTWTKDMYADPADRERVSGMDPLPSAEVCPTADTAGYATHLTEFVTADRTAFPACNADQMPPEAAVDGAFPPAEIAAFTDLDGNGSAQFEVRSDVENESLGCSDEVACSIVVIPIAGISCDRPASPTTRVDRECRKTGTFKPGESNFTNLAADQAVGPGLWWSASNWRNRFSIPITFGLPPDVCTILDTRPAVGFYGSELLAQAALQWAPAYCLDEKRFKFEHNQMSDVAGFNLMQTGQSPAAVVSSEQERTTDDPVGYAPTALTGFGIGYVVDKPDNAGEVTNLKLNARLIAKLLTQSYLGSDLGRGHPGIGSNPLAIMSDPEFYGLNKHLSRNPQEAGAALLSLSDSSDVMQQLTEYIAQDKDAMAFVNGKPDPWGMKVNPSYRGIELPTAEWPLLDTYIPETEDQCRQDNPVVYFNQLAAPVTRLRQIAEAVLDGWPNVQTRCEYDPVGDRYKQSRVEQQSFGSRFVLGLVSLGDAARYGLRTASLETKPHRYVGATPASIGAAVALSEQDGPMDPYRLDQADVVRNGRAYPGTMVVYTAALTRGLEKDEARDVAMFMRISVNEGQRPGSGNGQLPEGFVPIRATGPTAKLRTTALRVADAVEAQDPGTTPGGETDGDGDGTPDGGSGGPDGSGDAPGLGGVDPFDVPEVEAPGSSEPGEDEVSDLPVTSAETQPTSATDGDRSKLMGTLFPLLLLAGGIGLAYTVASRFLVRRPPGGSS